MVAMPYLQKQIVNGQVVAGPYLAGNPTLRAEITQISGTCSCANQKYNSLQTVAAQALQHGLRISGGLHLVERHVGFDRLLRRGRPGRRAVGLLAEPLQPQRPNGVRPTSTSSRTSSARSSTNCPSAATKKFGSNWNRGRRRVLGGWQMGGIFTAHTGFPLTIKMSGDPSGTGARSFRANVIGTPNDPHQIGPGVLFLDPTAYAVPTAAPSVTPASASCAGPA